METGLAQTTGTMAETAPVEIRDTGPIPDMGMGTDTVRAPEALRGDISTMGVHTAR